MKNSHCAILIQWSDEDEAYIVTIPELPGCKTHGDAYGDAVKNAQEVVELCVRSEQELGRFILGPNMYAA